MTTVIDSPILIVRLASSWPYLAHYRKVAETILALRFASNNNTG
jgi:hypothetical protein